MSELAVSEFKRLPASVVPIHYDLRLLPNLETFLFAGEVAVNVEVKVQTSTITLNSIDLEVISLAWSDETNREYATKWMLDEKTESLNVTVDPPLQPGNGILKISFTGTLNDKLKGFYRSKYMTPSGEVRYNAVTQFEATDARRAFPCWDEPAIRATFDITLVVPADKVALSNMPVKCDKSLDCGLREVSYERTPIMSTYLTAFIVGEFDYVEDVTTEGTPVRVYTPIGKKEQGRYALHVATKVLPYYKEYFGIGYNLPKMDLIAIADFAIGAMENWGLVTYRETRLLVDEVETSAMNRQYVALVVGHELAHQWFGNLVALEWWTHLWLKEGFASFIEFLCVDYLFPEYDIWTQFVTETLITALELDALDNSHPIEVAVSNPAQIDEIFDRISYDKGASIIRMLHDFVGAEAFKKGLNIYLTRHQYGNAATEDLWEALSESSGKPINKVMSTWTKQKGYPLISVTEKQQGNDRILTVRQRKFCVSTALSDSFHWLVPLTFSTSANPKEIVEQYLLEENSAEIVLSGVEENQWVKINPGYVGYYRVHYTSEILSRFIPSIRDKSLPPLDRLSLLDDIFALSQTGDKSAVEVLKFCEAYSNEDNLTVWTSISNILGWLLRMLDGTDCFPLLQQFARQQFREIAERMGWEPKTAESHSDAMLRSLVLSRMVNLKHTSFIMEAKRKFESHVTGEGLVASDLRNAVYRAVLSDADRKMFNRILELFRISDSAEEKVRIGRALGSLQHPDLIREALEFFISDDVRSQDTVIFMVHAGLSSVGRDLVWEFFKEKFQFFMNRYSTNRFVSHLIDNVLGNYSSKDKAIEIESFFSQNPCPGTERAVQQACESIYRNEVWMSNNVNDILEYLRSVA